MSNKKTRWILYGVAVVALTLFLVGGCSLEEPVSIGQRAQRFMSDLNADNWSQMYTHVHPDEGWRGIARETGTWTPSPFPSGNYGYSVINTTSDRANVTLTAPPTPFLAGETLVLHMRRDGDVWYVRQINRGDGTQLLP